MSRTSVRHCIAPELRATPASTLLYETRIVGTGARLVVRQHDLPCVLRDPFCHVCVRRAPPVRCDGRNLMVPLNSLERPEFRRFTGECTEFTTSRMIQCGCNQDVFRDDNRRGRELKRLMTWVEKAESKYAEVTTVSTILDMLRVFHSHSSTVR